MADWILQKSVAALQAAALRSADEPRHGPGGWTLRRPPSHSPNIALETSLHWHLVVGTNTIRNLHFAAPLSATLENDNFTLSLACDSYSIAQTHAAIAAVLVCYETAAQRDAAIAAALHQERAHRRGPARQQHHGSNEAIDLSSYYTSAQTDAAITAALVPVALSNAPNRVDGEPSNMGAAENLHFAGGP